MPFDINLKYDGPEDLFDTMVRLAGPNPRWDEKLNALAEKMNQLESKLDLILNADNLPMPRPPKPPKENED